MYKRHHSRRVAAPGGGVQGAAEPVGLFAEMQQVSDEEALAARKWLGAQGDDVPDGSQPGKPI